MVCFATDNSPHEQTLHFTGRFGNTGVFFFGGKNRYNMGVAEDFFARPRSLHVYYARVVTLFTTNCVLVCFKATAPDVVVARMKR